MRRHTNIARDFRTTDVDEAMEHLRENYGHIELRGEGVEYDISLRGDQRFSVGTVHLGGDLDLDGICDGFTVVSGSDEYRWEVDEDRGALGSAPVLYHPDVSFRAEADHVRVNIVRFDTAEIERVARLAFDDERLHLGFDGARPISAARSAAWAPMVRSVIARRDELENDLIRAAVYRQLAAAAWGTFRFEHTASRRPVTARGAAVAYRAASAFIDENAHLPITVDDVAAAAGVSTLRLGRIFLHHAEPQEGPQARIRRVRLAAAHREITCGTPGDLSLGDIAARWGFTQEALVRHYRRRFGEDPRSIR